MMLKMEKMNLYKIKKIKNKQFSIDKNCNYKFKKNIIIYYYFYNLHHKK